LPDENPEGPLPSRSFAGGDESATQDLDGRGPLARAVEPGERGFDQLALDARALEALADAGDAPTPSSARRSCASSSA